MMPRLRHALVALALLASACAGVLGIRPKNAERPFEHRAHSVKGVACNQCHAGVAGAGDQGPLHLPDTERCVTCHKTPHDARSCDHCHGPVSYTHLTLPTILRV